MPLQSWLLVAIGIMCAGCSGSSIAPNAVEERPTPPPTAYQGLLPAAAAAAIPAVGTSGGDQEEARAASRMIAETVAPAGRPGPVRVRPTSGRARMVASVATEARRVALTFDAGADRGYAESILDTLKTEGVRASFGMTGQWAEANPDLLRRMVDEGHHLINHTQTHDSFTGHSTGRGPKSFEARIRELELTEQAVRRIANATTKPYFRPPYGDLDASVVDDVGSQGYEIVAMWTVDSLGWNGLSRADIEARCLRLAAPGAVYIFHVGSAAQDGPALPAVIRGLRRAGFEMGTLDWLLHP